MSLRGHVDSSGFPLQIAVENAINQYHDHGYSVLFREHAWCTQDELNDGFADLVVSNDAQTIMLVIECKRVTDSEWAFLIDSAEKPFRRRDKVFIHYQTHEGLHSFEWIEIPVDPVTPESAFCSMPGDSGRRPLIERTCAELVKACEGIANEQRALPTQGAETFQIILPVLVTTAKLFTCIYDAESISLETGKLGPAEFCEIPYLRFRKQVSTRHEIPDEYRSSEPRRLARAKENTIFIVNAASINEFLAAFDIDNHALNQHLRISRKVSHFITTSRD